MMHMHFDDQKDILRAVMGFGLRVKEGMIILGIRISVAMLMSYYICHHQYKSLTLTHPMQKL